MNMALSTTYESGAFEYTSSRRKRRGRTTAGGLAALNSNETNRRSSLALAKKNQQHPQKSLFTPAKRAINNEPQPRSSKKKAKTKGAKSTSNNNNTKGKRGRKRSSTSTVSSSSKQAQAHKGKLCVLADADTESEAGRTDHLDEEEKSDHRESCSSANGLSSHTSKPVGRKRARYSTKELDTNTQLVKENARLNAIVRKLGDEAKALRHRLQLAENTATSAVQARIRAHAEKADESVVKLQLRIASLEDDKTQIQENVHTATRTVNELRQRVSILEAEKEELRATGVKLLTACEAVLQRARQQQKAQNESEEHSHDSDEDEDSENESESMDSEPETTDIASSSMVQPKASGLRSTVKPLRARVSSFKTIN